MISLLAPFLLGLASSLHCIGMCSPLVLAVSGKGTGMIFRNLQYNLGRILTYGVLGSIVSLVGKGLSLAGLQEAVSIVAGLALLVIGVTSMRVAMPVYVSAPLLRFTNGLKSQFQQVAKGRNVMGIVVLGMTNGLLPCGMTLVALGYCITLQGPWDGFYAMVLFGLGTIPAMVGFASIARSLVGRLKIGYSTLQAGLIIFCAVLLIGRGIWYFGNPESNAGKEGIVVCGSVGVP
jgi:sulfite exporter TauE/SafE